MNMPPSGTLSGYRFGDITLDVARRRVRRGDSDIQVGKLSYELLVLLAEAAPRVVTREELVEQVWGGRYVSSDTMKQRIKRLRQALSDDADQPRYINVVRGQGYGLIPDIEAFYDEPPVASRWRRPVLAAASVLLGLAVLIGIYLFNLDTSAPVSPRSVAVLPFKNLSPNPDEAYFAVGLHDEILSQLAKLSNLSVISRTSMLRYADSDLSIPEIARELNVGTVMEGSVRYADDRVRITTQLIDAATDEQLWSETYEREFADIFAIESDIAMNVANALEAEFSLEEQQRIEEIPTDSFEAHALYLRARTIVLEAQTDPGINRNRNRIESLLLTAIDLDPEFALAYVSLARIYANLGEEAPTLEYAHKALELDPDLGAAYVAMTNMYFRTGRFDEAVETIEQGVQRSPSDPVVLIRHALVLVPVGRADESLRILDRVLELDPASPGTYFTAAIVRWDAGDRGGGLVAMRRSVELDPENFRGHRELSMMEATLGNRAEAAAHVQLAERLDPSLQPTTVTAYAYRLAGLNDDATRVARAWAESIEEFPSGVLPIYYHLVLDEEEQALHALAQVIENPPSVGRQEVEVMTNPFDDPILDKPEFEALRAELRAKVGWN